MAEKKGESSSQKKDGEGGVRSLSAGSLSEPESDGTHQTANARQANAPLPFDGVPIPIPRHPDVIPNPNPLPPNGLFSKANLPSRHKAFEYEEFMDPNYARIFAGSGCIPPPPPYEKKPNENVWDSVPYAEHLVAYARTQQWTSTQLRFPLPAEGERICPMHSSPQGCSFNVGSRNHYRRHLASHLPFGIGYFFCCPLCNTPTSRGDNFKRHLGKCVVWTREGEDGEEGGGRPDISEAELKAGYQDNIWLRWVFLLSSLLLMTMGLMMR